MDGPASSVTDGSPRSPEEALQLVRQAFALAKASGREHWQTMNLAVLKNRLLDITDRRFDESEWGAATLRDFVGLLEPVVRLETGGGPARVVLDQEAEIAPFEAVAAAAPARRAGGWSIRPDLWEAVIDYRSGRRYAWVDGYGEALEADEELPAGARVLPTVDREQLIAWRRAFARARAESGVPDGTLDAWSASDDTSRSLPPRQRNQWFGALKRHVRARLEEWFAAEGVEPPDDLVVLDAERPAEREDDVERLRRTLLKLVQTMTAEELRALSLPASAVARVLR